MTYRNRIVGHGEEAPDQLAANPRNWRIHPHGQERVLEGSLSEVGWVDTVLVNKRTGFVIDGHLRVSHAISRGESSVPVTYVDLDEAEEGLVLATLDPISALASTDSAALSGLLSELDTDNAALNRFLEEMLSSVPRISEPTEELNLTTDERLEVYEHGAQRQIMLLFNLQEYADVMWQFGQMMARYPELETNVDVVKWLLTKEVGDRASQE